MPKMKSISSAKKRFKVTGSGRIKRAKANRGHLLTDKPMKRNRRLRKTVGVDSSNLTQVKRMLIK